MIDANHLKAHRTAASLLKKDLFPDVSGEPRAAQAPATASDATSRRCGGILRTNRSGTGKPVNRRNAPTRRLRQ